MVIESLKNPLQAEKNPWKIILLGGLYTIIGLFFAWWAFRAQSSIVFVFFTAMAAIPLIYKLMNFEEKKDLSLQNETSILKEHLKSIGVVLALFLGVVIVVTIVFVIISPQATNTLFQVQLQTIGELGHSSSVSDITGNAVSQMTSFTKIFFNNMRVLTFCILFSLIYGIGAIFVLTWNASVIGVALGNFIRLELSKLAGFFGFGHLGAYLSIGACGIFRFFIHGIPEIGGYVVGALAGGILSASIMKHNLDKKHIEKILVDAADLLLIAVILIFLAAVLEVWVTPGIFGILQCI